MDACQSMYDHFACLASDYRRLRTTNVEPITFIAERLKPLPEIKAADIGCGAGRYDLLLLQHLPHLHLTCADINHCMLEQVSDYLTGQGFTNFNTLKVGPDDMPLADESLDCILTFNAIHHFDFIKFIQNCRRVLKEDGWVFIYTRLRSQNAKNIWGMHFPLFSEKETRLYELDEMRQTIDSIEILAIEAIKYFKYHRTATLKHLLERVRLRHYSTFSLYEERELSEHIEVFKYNIKHSFQDPNRIEWFDENIILLLRPRQNISPCRTGREKG